MKDDKPYDRFELSFDKHISDQNKHDESDIDDRYDKLFKFSFFDETEKQKYELESKNLTLDNITTPCNDVEFENFVDTIENVRKQYLNDIDHIMNRIYEQEISSDSDLDEINTNNTIEPKELPKKRKTEIIDLTKEEKELEKKTQEFFMPVLEIRSDSEQSIHINVIEEKEDPIDKIQEQPEKNLDEWEFQYQDERLFGTDTDEIESINPIEDYLKLLNDNVNDAVTQLKADNLDKEISWNYIAYSLQQAYLKLLPECPTNLQMVKFGACIYHCFEDTIVEQHLDAILDFYAGVSAKFINDLENINVNITQDKKMSKWFDQKFSLYKIKYNINLEQEEFTESKSQSKSIRVSFSKKK